MRLFVVGMTELTIQFWQDTNTKPPDFLETHFSGHRVALSRSMLRVWLWCYIRAVLTFQISILLSVCLAVALAAAQISSWATFYGLLPLT